MCFNKEVSLIVFIFGLLSGIKVILDSKKYSSINYDHVFTLDTNPNERSEYQKKALVTGIFIILVSLMQLNEFFLWGTIENKRNTRSGACVKRGNVLDKDANNFWSWILIATLVAQIVGFYFAEYGTGIVGVNDPEDEEYPLDVSITVLMSLFLVITVAITYCLPNGILSPRGSGCRLVWAPFRKQYGCFSFAGIFALTYIVLVTMMSFKIFGNKAFVLLAATLGAAMAYGFYYKAGLTAIWGSFWCFLVMFTGVLAGIFDYLPGNEDDINVRRLTKVG